VTIRRHQGTAGALSCLLLAGCIQLTYSVQSVEGQLPAAALASLQPAVDDLGSCLRKLGAPHYVWEYLGDGVALGWVALDASGWSFEVGYNFERFFTTSFALDTASSNLPGVVLWFDADLRLKKWRQGRMRDLTSGLHRRPAPVDESGG